MTRQRGFTLLEVMLGLALLGLALTVLIKSAANSIFNAEQAHMMGVTTNLARAKMYDIEEILLKDGFSDTSQSQESEECFTDEGWPNVCYSYTVEEPKIPTLQEIQEMAAGKAKAELGAAAGSAGSALGSDAAELLEAGGIENTMLGGIMSQMGMSAGDLTGGIEGGAAGSMISSQYSMFQEVLKVSVRKVALRITWTVLGSKREMKVVAFFTDANAMNKTLLGQLAGAAETFGTGSGSGSGSGSTTPKLPGRGASK